MSIKFSGLDELQNDLRRMADGARELERTSEVSFEELFTSNFMLQHSNFSSIDELFDAGGFHVETNEDFEAIPDDVFDLHISKHTDFSNWDDMLGAATEEYVSRKLGF